jgi:L-lactate dehydrogenase complex protein LldE
VRVETNADLSEISNCRTHAKPMIPENRTVSRDVQFMITCLCDTFYDSVARAAVEVLEHVGCRVSVPDSQTCCGQPAFNAGDWDAARKVIRHTQRTFTGNHPIIIPSGSCAHMVFHGYGLAFENGTDAEKEAVNALTARSWEICDYLVNGLGIQSWPGRFEGKISLHRSCHTRGSDTYSAALQLLRSIEGLEVLEFDESEQCCGFGGTFSVAYPNTSSAMGTLKIDKLTAVKPDLIGAVDMACMLHLSGLAEKQQRPFRKLHVVEILLQSLHHANPGPTR